MFNYNFLVHFSISETDIFLTPFLYMYSNSGCQKPYKNWQIYIKILTTLFYSFSEQVFIPILKLINNLNKYLLNLLHNITAFKLFLNKNFMGG